MADIGGPGARLPFTPYEMHDPALIGMKSLGPTGLAALLARPGLRDALMATGMALLAQKDQPGSLGGALGRALPMGMQAFQQGQQNAQVDALIAQAPPEMQQLLRSLPRDRQGAALFALMQPKPAPEPVSVAPNAALVDPVTRKEVYRNTPIPEPEKPAELPADLRAAAWALGVDLDAVPPEQRASVMEKYAELKRAGGTTVNVGDQQDFGNINTLADDFRTEAAGAREIADAVRRATAAGNSAVGDQTRIIALNKLLDPTSIVREGEFDRVGTAGGFTARAQYYYSKMTNGRLPEDIRRQIDREIMGQARAARESFLPVYNQYNARATQAGLDPAAVTRDYFAGLKLDNPYADLVPGGR